MNDPISIKEFQKLIGWIAALRRFILQTLKKCLPFFQIIKDASKTRKILLNDECKQRFADLKKFLTNVPILLRALQRETLRVYLSACNYTVAALLVKQRKTKNSQSTMLVIHW